MARPDPMSTWLAEHADDAVLVGLVELMELAARLAQLAEDGAGDRDALLRRLTDTDLPRLQAALPPEAMEIVSEEIR